MSDQPESSKTHLELLESHLLEKPSAKLKPSTFVRVDLLSQLPAEIAYCIIGYLAPGDLMACAGVSRTWRRLCEDNRTWQRKCLENGYVKLDAPSFRFFGGWAENRANVEAILPHMEADHSRRERESAYGQCYERSAWKSLYLRKQRIISNWRSRAIQSSAFLECDDCTIGCLQIHSGRIVAGFQHGSLRVWNVDDAQICESVDKCFKMKKSKEIVFLVILVSLLAINYRRDLWEIALWLEDEYFPLKASLIKCFDRSRIASKYPLLGEGWNKRVYAFDDFALKTPHALGHSMRLCQQKFLTKIDSEQLCQLQLRESFLREVLWLKRLENDANVPKLFSYCAEPDNYSILIEKGQPVTTLSLLAVTLQQRITIAHQITHFLLRNSKIDFRDFRRQQFVLNEKFVPLFVDFDDVVEKGHGNDDTKTLTQIYRSMIYEFLAVGANETQVEILSEKRYSQKNRSEIETLDLSTLRHLDQVHERGHLSVHLLDEFLRKL